MAKQSQLFKIAGITVHGDNAKVRFTDDLVRRLKQFTKGGASRVDLVELPSAMSKLDALAYLKTCAEFQSPGDQVTIAEAITDRTPKVPVVKVPKVKAVKVPKAPKAEKVVVAKVAKAPKAAKVSVVVAKPSLAALKARAQKATLAEADAKSEA